MTAGFGTASPTQGASVDASIYTFELCGGSFNGCPRGSYEWVVTLIDPYFRAASNTSGRGWFTCR